MGQPGGNDIEIHGRNMGGNTYYCDCKTCEKNKPLRLGNIGKHPNDRNIAVNNCKHRGSDKQFKANGALCTGYEPGFKYS